MKKNLLFLFLLLCGHAGLSQTAKLKNDSVYHLVQRYFNAKDGKALYALTGNDFKKEIPENLFLDICRTNLFTLGNFQGSFESISGNVSKYKAVFPATTMQFFLGLDSTDKLETFQFKPYQEERLKPDKTPADNPLKTVLDSAVDKAASAYIHQAAAHGLSIGILKNDSLYFYGYGETETGSPVVPGKNTLFEIGSITKTFTATLLALAVNEGKVNLNDPVSKYLPDIHSALRWKNTEITVKMLSNHTSGMIRMTEDFDSVAADPTDPYANYTKEMLGQFYQTYQPGRKPGAQYEYSNLAVATLGLLLERLYQKPFDQLVDEKICRPLGMNDTRQYLVKADSVRLAKGYDESGSYNGPWNFKVFAAAGALRSTASDMLLYAKANLDTTSALQKAMALTHIVTLSDGKNKVGLGWHYIKPGKEELLWHNGGTGGYRSYLGINLKRKFAVVVLSNTAIGTEAVGNNIIRYLEQ